MTLRRSPGRRAALSVSGVLLAVLAGSLTAPVQAAPLPRPQQAVDCPVAVPIESVTKGMVGEGWTVVSGSTPEPFSVEVLGVLDNVFAGGRDLILVRVSDLAGGHVIDQGGGLWAGISGSPVYVDGKLLGALAYTVSASPSPIGALTPAAEMLDLLNLPAAVAARPDRVGRPDPTVRLSTPLRRDLAKAGVPVPRGATLQQLVTPMGVSGLSARQIARLQTEADAAGWSVKAYAAGRAAAPRAGVAPTARPQVGGNFAAALSYGDLTAGAFGTTTVVCGNQALAFGHPLAFRGPVRYGASDADAVAIIKDETFGSFKLANFGADVGTVDQDRFAGIRADLTALPASASVTTVIRNVDTGEQRTGITRVVDPASLPGLLPFAILANYEVVFDELGDGTATSAWTITGTRAGNVPFSISRSNRWASLGEVPVEPATEVAAAADALANNEFEEVTIDGVTFDSAVATKFEQLSILRTAVSVNGARYTAAPQLAVKVGDRLRIRVRLRHYRSTATSLAVMELTIPPSARGKVGMLALTGGETLATPDTGLEPGCLLSPEACSVEQEGSLDAIIRDITGAPRNDSVVAQLILEPDPSAAPAASDTQLQNLTVIGNRSIILQVRR